VLQCVAVCLSEITPRLELEVCARANICVQALRHVCAKSLLVRQESRVAVVCCKRLRTTCVPRNSLGKRNLYNRLYSAEETYNFKDSIDSASAGVAEGGEGRVRGVIE